MADRVEREALAEDVVRKIEGIAISSAVIRCYYRKEYRIAAAAINAALALPAEPPQGELRCPVTVNNLGEHIRCAYHPKRSGALATPAPSEDGNGGSYPIFFCTCGHDRATHEISPPYPCAEDCDCKSFTFQKKTYAPNAVGTP